LNPVLDITYNPNKNHRNMKYLAACAPLCAVLLLTGCAQSPQKLVATANKYHQNKKYTEASILYQKAIAKDKTNEEAYYREGLNLIDSGQPGQAAPYLRRAVDLKSDNTDAAAKLAEIYLAYYSRDPQKNKNLLPDIRDLDAKILQHDPNSFDGIRLKGLIDLADNQRDQALQEFAKANQIRPYARDLVGWYARALELNNEPDKAVALVKDMLAHDSTWGPGYDFLFVYYTRLRNNQQAEAVLRERVQNNPKSVAAVSTLANYLAASGRSGEGEQVMKRVLDDKAAFPNGHQLMGDFYTRQNNFDAALKQYEAGAAEDPKQALKYRERMVDVYQLKGDHAGALRLAKELVQKNPKEASADELYAAVLMRSGSPSDLKNSLSELKSLAQKNPSSAMLHLDLATAYFETGDTDRALTEANDAIRLNRNLLPAYIVAGRINEDKGQHAKAIELSETVLAAQPQNPDARLIHARADLGLGDVDKAQAELQPLVQQFPRMNDARLALGSIYLAKRDYQKAAELYQAVANSNPPDIRGFIGLQTVKVQMGKADEAVQAMRDLAQKNPTVLAYRYQLANFEAADAQQAAKTDPAHSKALMEEAIDNYKQILKTDVNSADVWVRLGALQRELGQSDAALASFQQAERADSKNPVPALNEAMMLEAMGKKSQAVEAYNKVLGIEPNNALALNNLAFLNAESGTNLDQAMTFAERAKQEAPKSPDVSDTLGYVYYQKHLNSEALQIFRQLVQDNPKNPTFHLHLAMALLKQGDKQGAREEAEKALKDASQPSDQEKIRSFVNQIG
jgi:tetratricopeptide (TPR) repeat protein